jgi:hypothetical protein
VTAGCERDAVPPHVVRGTPFWGKYSPTCPPPQVGARSNPIRSQLLYYLPDGQRRGFVPGRRQVDRSVRRPPSVGHWSPCPVGPLSCRPRPGRPGERPRCCARANGKLTSPLRGETQGADAGTPYLTMYCAQPQVAPQGFSKPLDERLLCHSERREERHGSTLPVIMESLRHRWVSPSAHDREDA